MNDSSRSTTRSWFAAPPAAGVTTLGVVLLASAGVWELSRGQAHIPHVLTVFIAVICLALVVIVFEWLAQRTLINEARLSQERLRSALLAGNSVIWDMDVNTGHIYWFGDLATMFGIASDIKTVKLGDFYRYVHHEDRQRVAEAVNNARESHTPYETEFRIVHENGMVRWVNATGEFRYTKKGEAFRMVGLAMDITERCLTEQALRISEEKFRRVVEHIGDAVIADDAEGRIIFANDRFLDLFGFRREQLPELRIEYLVTPEFRDAVIDCHRRRLRGESVPTHFEYEGVRTDGSRLWFEVDVVPITDSDGTISGTQSAMRNITQRRRAEQALRESEERFRLVANTAPVMIWMRDTDNLCAYVNQTWLDFTGRRFAAELGMGWTHGIHPEDVESCLEQSADSFERRAPVEVQYRLKRHDGEYRWIFDIGVPRFESDGTFAGYIGSCIDITERKLAEDALATIGRRLIEAHEEERTRIGRELHDDVNQKLALLAVELDRWADTTTRSEGIRELVQRAQVRITNIAKDVQHLSHRLHSSKLEYLGLAKAAGSFCNELAQQNRVQIRFSHEGLPPSIPKEISVCVFRVLQEALQNAVKHSGVTVFSVALRGTSDWVDLTVTDQGRGFDHEDTLTQAGLGLISMRERLQLVDGDLTVKSRPGIGTTIHARVPLPSKLQSIAS